MHVLPLEWSNGSWTYTQESRDGDIAIYQQKHKEGSALRFEVIRVQQLEEKPLPKGGIREAGEYYPSSSSWGKNGWTCFTLEEAQALAQTLR